jgi:hypothetical protein
MGNLTKAVATRSIERPLEPKEPRPDMLALSLVVVLLSLLLPVLIGEPGVRGVPARFR